MTENIPALIAEAKKLMADSEYGNRHDRSRMIESLVTALESLSAPSGDDREAQADREDVTALVAWIRDLAAWEHEHGSDDNAERFDATAEALSRPSQPLQVEVTDKMLKRAEIAHHEYWCGANPDHNTRECEGGIPRGLLRVLLTAALGGGDHAE